MGIAVKDLSFSYKKDTPVLKGLSFELHSGRYYCLLGPNGVGKSTLFRCMLGLERGYEGEILLDGEDIGKMSAKQLALRAAYIPQSTAPAFNYSVGEVVLMGTTVLGGSLSSPGERERQHAQTAMEELGIAHLCDRGFMNISGGERQLALIARALAQQADILLMDEPTANLDYGNRLRVSDCVKELSRRGYTVIQSTHDPEQAFLYADEVLALYGGELCAKGAPEKVLDAALIGKLYGVRVRVTSVPGSGVKVCVPEFNKTTDKQNSNTQGGLS